MHNKHIRKTLRDPSTPVQFHILVIEQDQHYALALKLEIESQLPVNVVTVHSIDAARLILSEQPNTFFLGITSVINLDSDAFEKVDLLGEFNIPIIAIVSRYEDEMRDQLIKRHVIDYVVKDQSDDITYICELISRVHKTYPSRY